MICHISEIVVWAFSGKIVEYSKRFMTSHPWPALRIRHSGYTIWRGGRTQGFSLPRLDMTRVRHRIIFILYYGVGPRWRQCSLNVHRYDAFVHERMTMCQQQCTQRVALGRSYGYACSCFVPALARLGESCLIKSSKSSHLCAASTLRAAIPTLLATRSRSAIAGADSDLLNGPV